MAKTKEIIASLRGGETGPLRGVNDPNGRSNERLLSVGDQVTDFGVRIDVGRYGRWYQRTNDYVIFLFEDQGLEGHGRRKLNFPGSTHVRARGFDQALAKAPKALIEDPQTRQILADNGISVPPRPSESPSRRVSGPVEKRSAGGSFGTSGHSSDKSGGRPRPTGRPR